MVKYNLNIEIVGYVFNELIGVKINKEIFLYLNREKFLYLKIVSIFVVLL